MTKKAMKRIALYARASTQDQIRPGDDGTVPTQLSRLRATAETKWPGCEVVEFRDEARSGGSVDRPALQRMLGEVEEQTLDAVLVTRLDRMSRNVRNFLDLDDNFTSRGVELVSLHENFDTTTSQGRMMRTVFLALAQMEREQAGERAIAHMAERARKGLPNGGPPVLGFDKVNGRLVPKEDELALVKEIEAKYIETHSASAVAQWLDERGLRQKTYYSERRKGHRGGGRFTPAVVRRILTNPVYLGMIVYRGEQLQGAHDAVRPQETHARIQAIMERNRVKKVGKPVRQHEFLLTGLVTCSCGFRLTSSAGTSKSGTRHFYYRCGGFTKRAKHECEVRQVRAEQLEDAVVQLVYALGECPQLVAKSADQANKLLSERVKPIERSLSRLRRERAQCKRDRNLLLSRLIELKLEDSSTARARLADLEQIDADLKAAEQDAALELSMARRAAADTEVLLMNLASFKIGFEHLSPGQRKAVLALIVRDIRVSPGEVVVELFQGSELRLPSPLGDGAPQKQNTPVVLTGVFADRSVWLRQQDSNLRQVG